MWTKNERLRKNESGAALVIALIMIIVLTLIGLASTFTSNFEIKLSGNKRGSTDAFYAADSGAQSVLVHIANFNVPGQYQDVDTNGDGVADFPLPGNPPDIQSESIDKAFTSFDSPPPVLALPAGVVFATAPQVAIYHTTLTGAPRGGGGSATATTYEYEHYILDSIGVDQLEVASARSTSQVREKIIRLVPAS